MPSPEGSGWRGGTPAQKRNNDKHGATSRAYHTPHWDTTKQRKGGGGPVTDSCTRETDTANPIHPSNGPPRKPFLQHLDYSPRTRPGSYLPFPTGVMTTETCAPEHAMPLLYLPLSDQLPRKSAAALVAGGHPPGHLVPRAVLFQSAVAVGVEIVGEHSVAVFRERDSKRPDAGHHVAHYRWRLLRLSGLPLPDDFDEPLMLGLEEGFCGGLRGVVRRGIDD